SGNDSSSVAKPTLVAGDMDAVRRLADASTATPIANTEARGSQVDRFTPNVELTRNQAIRSALAKRGFSDEATDLYVKSYKGGEQVGTLRKHENAFKRYQSWCKTNRI